MLRISSRVLAALSMGIIASALSAACGSSDDSSVSAESAAGAGCVEGSSQACACTDGRSGAQQCVGGAYQPCMCTGAAAGSTGATGSTGGAGGATATGGTTSAGGSTSTTGDGGTTTATGGAECTASDVSACPEPPQFGGGFGGGGGLAVCCTADGICGYEFNGNCFDPNQNNTQTDAGTTTAAEACTDADLSSCASDPPCCSSGGLCGREVTFNANTFCIEDGSGFGGGGGGGGFQPPAP